MDLFEILVFQLDPSHSSFTHRSTIPYQAKTGETVDGYNGLDCFKRDTGKRVYSEETRVTSETRQNDAITLSAMWAQITY